MSFFEGWTARYFAGFFLLALLLILIEYTIRTHRRHKARTKLAREAVEEFQRAQVNKLMLQSSARAQPYSIAETYYQVDEVVPAPSAHNRSCGELRIDSIEVDANRRSPPPPYTQTEDNSRLIRTASSPNNGNYTLATMFDRVQ